MPKKNKILADENKLKISAIADFSLCLPSVKGHGKTYPDEEFQDQLKKMKPS